LFRRDELLGNTIDSLIVPVEQAEEARQFVKLIAPGQKVHANLQRKRKDGNHIEIELNAVPLVLL
jgi:PAS domain S-box-containing protein